MLLILLKELQIDNLSAILKSRLLLLIYAHSKYLYSVRFLFFLQGEIYEEEVINDINVNNVIGIINICR